MFAFKRLLLLALLFFLVLANTATSQSCMWFPANNSSHKQVEGPSVEYQGEMYVFAGFGCNQFNNRCGSVIQNITERFDPAVGTAGQWTNLRAMPMGVTHVPAVVVESEIWLIGGFKGDHGGPSTDTVQIYNPANDTWRYGPKLPAAFAAGGTVYIGRKVYVFGGLLPDRRTETGAHYVYDMDNTALGWQTLAAMPTPRNHMGFGTIAGKIYTVGGQVGHDCCTEDRDQLEVYDPETNTWATMAPMPDSISHMECGTFVKDGIIYAVGGNTNTYTVNRWIHTYNSATNTWTRSCDLPIKMWNPAAQIIGDKMILAHGGEWTYLVPSDKAYTQNVTRNRRLELGYSRNQETITLQSNQTGIIDVLAFTISGDTRFKFNSADFPLWLTSVNSSGNRLSPTGEKLTINIDPFAMGPGQYTFDLIIDENTSGTLRGYQPDTLEITLNVLTGSPLSVDGIHGFEVHMLPNGIPQLSWATQDETQLQHATIERRYFHDAEFEPVYTIASRAEIPTEGDSYRFLDSSIMQTAKRIEYRLRFVSYNGTSYYSPVRVLWQYDPAKMLTVYPNPAKNYIMLDFDILVDGIYETKLFTLSGIVAKGPFPKNISNIYVGDLTPGCYILEVATSAGLIRKKVLIQ